MYTQYIQYLTILYNGINIGSCGLVYHVSLNFYNGIHLIAVIYSVIHWITNRVRVNTIKISY